MPPSPAEVTQLLLKARDGDSQARDDLLKAVYDELRAQARACFRRERPDHTLEATALVNEVCLRLLAGDSLPGENRMQFLAFVAKAMRHVLIDHARERGRRKRGGGRQKVPLDGDLLVAEEPSIDLLALDEALERLAKIDERKARVVELRYFGGLSVEEVASHLAVAPITVKRDWEVARTWLHAELMKGDGPAPER
jgi:RNA polymerase sigma factor (TIGR02999 family)